MHVALLERDRQRAMGRRVAREDEQPRDLLVDAVHDEQPLAARAFEQALRGRLSEIALGDRGEPRGLVHDDDQRVLEHRHQRVWRHRRLVRHGCLACFIGAPYGRAQLASTSNSCYPNAVRFGGHGLTPWSHDLVRRHLFLAHRHIVAADLDGNTAALKTS